MGDSNIYAPVVACLAQALLMSIILNIYLICMKRHRELAQRCHNLATCRRSNYTKQQEGETEEQTEAEGVQYAAMDFSVQRVKTENKSTETEKGETVYSEVANFGWE